MAMKHGIYTSEEATALTIPKEGESSIQVVIGTAPVNMAENPQACVNTPILANSATEAMKELGYSTDFKHYTLCQTMYLSENAFPVSPIVYINVLDPKKHTKAVDAKEYQINNRQFTIEEEGVLRDSIIVTVGSTKDAKTKVTSDITDDDTLTELESIIEGTEPEDGSSKMSDSDYGKAWLVNALQIGASKSTALTDSEKKAIYAMTPDSVEAELISDGPRTVKYTIKISYKTYTFTVCQDPGKQEETVTAVLNEDYAVSFDAETGHAVVTVITGGKLDDVTSVTASAKALDPTKVTKENIIGAVDPDTGEETGIQVIRQVFPKLDVVPGLILAPGFSQIPEVGLALTAKASLLNGVYHSFALLDLDTEKAKKYTDTKKVKEDSGFTSEFSASLWPCSRIGDYIFAKSAVAGCLIEYIDHASDDVPYQSPSNHMMGTTGECLADGTEVILDRDQANTVNGYGIITAINQNGWRLWGNYTNTWPSSGDAKDVWVAVRRMFNWQGNTFINTYFDKVDKPMSKQNIQNIIDSENIRCNSYAPDKWAGAYIEYREDDNPATDIIAGKVTFRQHISPYTPMQDIENILNYDIDTLQAALQESDE